MRVALLGLGVMGKGMAGQILDHGHSLAVYNRTRERAADLGERGARVAGTPHAAVEGAEVVVTMITNDAALHDVAEGPDGFLGGLGQGAIVLQMSTVSPEATGWIDAQVRARGAALLDAPVMGSLPEAASGRLWVLAGGEAGVIERARPVLDSVSQTVYHVGDVGQGTRLKLCSNLVGGGLVAALSEGLALLDAAGLDPQLYIQILKDSDLPNRLWLGKAGLMASRDFAPRFSLDNMAKDIGLAVGLGRSLGLNMKQGEATLGTLCRGAQAVGGDKDMAAAFEGTRLGGE